MKEKNNQEASLQQRHIFVVKDWMFHTLFLHKIRKVGTFVYLKGSLDNFKYTSTSHIKSSSDTTAIPEVAWERGKKSPTDCDAIKLLWTEHQHSQQSTILKDVYQIMWNEGYKWHWSMLSPNLPQKKILELKLKEVPKLKQTPKAHHKINSFSTNWKQK